MRPVPHQIGLCLFSQDTQPIWTDSWGVILVLTGAWHTVFNSGITHQRNWFKYFKLCVSAPITCWVVWTRQCWHRKTESGAFWWFVKGKWGIQRPPSLCNFGRPQPATNNYAAIKTPSQPNNSNNYHNGWRHDCSWWHDGNSQTDKLVRNTMTMTWSKWLWRHNVFLYSILLPELKFVIKKTFIEDAVYQFQYINDYGIRCTELAETLHISSFRFLF